MVEIKLYQEISSLSYINHQNRSKFPHYFNIDMALRVLQTQHQHADPWNGHPLDNLNLNVE
jgi:hypothetical protein